IFSCYEYVCMTALLRNVYGWTCGLRLGPSTNGLGARRVCQNGHRHPGIAFEGIVMRDCGTAAPPTCACTTGLATGANLLSVFDGKDGSTPDCKISASEIAKSPFTAGLLGPDICS